MYFVGLRDPVSMFGKANRNGGGGDFAIDIDQEIKYTSCIVKFRQKLSIDR